MNMEKHFNEIKKESEAAFLVSIDQDGDLHIGLHGPTVLIIADLGGGVIHLQRESNWSFEEIGKELNKVVDEVKEDFYEFE